MEIQKLNTFIELAKSNKIKTLVVAVAQDLHVLQAVEKAVNNSIIKPILVGDKDKITTILNENNININSKSIIDIKDINKAVEKSVELIKEGKGDILMKGSISTGPLLKKVIDKENGLLKGSLLSHIAFFESPYYHKLLSVTDAAMNVSPDLNEKVAIINNAVEAYHKLGIKEPKVAIIASVEVVNPKMEATIHASLLNIMNQRNQIKGCIIDGPLALDNAISKEAATHKGINSKVAGDVDILVTPDINVGNVLYKSLNFIGGADSAAIIMGAQVPIVLTSRADSENTKFMSISLAAAMQ